MILDVANLPVPSSQSSISPQRQMIRKLIRKGWTSSEIAMKLAKGSPRKARVIRQAVRREMARDEVYKQMKAEAALGLFVESVEDTAEAVVKRASRGRIDAAKLAFEVSGFHNPRVQHEHSGEITVKVEAASRPPRVVDADVDDAEVVE